MLPRTGFAAPDARRIRRAATSLALLAAAAPYLPHLRKGFVSEDFLLVALHRAHPPWADLTALFGEPWLGMRLFEFYRPLAALVFGAEAAFFGGQSLGYNAVHLLVHVAATWLVLAIARSLLRMHAPDGDRRRAELAAFGAALFFALYPLAPNSVLFAGSFANLFGAAATLGAALSYLRWRELVCPAIPGDDAPARSPAAPLPLAAVALYGVALLCYESSFALPLWLVLLEVVAPGRVSERRRAAVAFVPFGAVALGYLLLRASLFDDPLGGYGEMAARLRAPDPDVAVAALRTMLRLPAPWFARGAPALEATAALVGCALAALWLARASRGGSRSLARLFLLGVGWTLAFAAPYSFQLVWPANGRYWYLSAAGTGIALAALLAAGYGALRTVPQRLVASLVTVLLLALLGRNAGQLHRHLEWMEEAAETAAAIAGEIERVATGERLFVLDHPLFVTSPEGINRAQVYHYGLRAAVGPPFRERQIDVYPLPPRSEADPRRLALRHPVYRWSPAERRLVRLTPRAAALPALLEIESTPDGAALVAPETSTVRPQGGRWPAGAVSAAVVVSARGNYGIATGAVTASHEGVPFPADFARFWARLAGGPQLFWVEARDARGRTLAASEPRWFEP